MSSPREEILARIRGRGSGGDAVHVDRRLGTPRRGPVPHWPEGPVERLRARLEAAAATVELVADPGDIAAAVQRYLQSEVPDAVPVLAPHPDLDAGDWGEAAERRPLEPSDTVGVTVARFGVAETGSLVMIAGPQTPTRYNFLPETCICVLRREAIVAHIEDVWAGLRALGEPMPRALNFVTGPSRTADVEQTLQLGAHGPRRLHVLISGSD